jgi:hypothetical protein
MKMRGSQQTAKREANALVIVNDRYIDVLVSAHRIP